MQFLSNDQDHNNIMGRETLAIGNIVKIAESLTKKSDAIIIVAIGIHHYNIVSL